MITHQSVVNFLSAFQLLLHLQADDLLLALTTLCFDIAALELFLPLCTGARLAIASRSLASDPHLLDSCLRSSNVSIIQATPSTWRMLIDAGWQGRSSLKVLCGGESLPQELAAALRERAGEVWNLYGPTETTIWSAAWELSAGQWSGRVSLGRPIANTQLYVLDEEMQPVAVGVSGELYIGGEGLGRGYWGRSEETAERFVPDALSGGLGRRMYRTGDVVRRRGDGEIEYVGRVDTQVKVRGYRIELGEVEAALALHPAVHQSAVTLREDTPGDARLVAYIVCGLENKSLNGALRHFLKERLPEYMIPQAFVMLDAMPLTPNGKVDRRALPRPDQSRPKIDAGFVAPRTPAEELVAEIWARVLGVEQVGVEDNFFELGGHSLLAVQLVARISDAFRVELPLRRLFEQPTVAGLVDAIALTWGDREIVEEIARTLQYVEQLSTDEVKNALPFNSQTFSHDPILPPEPGAPQTPVEDCVPHE